MHKPNLILRIRVDTKTYERLVDVSAAAVLPSEYSRNRRQNTRAVSPMVRLLGAGLYPVRISPENLVRLQMLMELVVNPNADLSTPDKVGPMISELLNKIATNQIKLIPK